MILSTSTVCLVFVPEEEELYLLKTLVVISVILSSFSVLGINAAAFHFKFISLPHCISLYSLFSTYFQACSRCIPGVVIFITGPGALFCCPFPHINFVYAVFILVISCSWYPCVSTFRFFKCVLFPCLLDLPLPFPTWSLLESLRFSRCTLRQRKFKWQKNYKRLDPLLD